MIKMLLTMVCFGFAVLAAEPESETWDLSLIRQDESGAALAKTSTTTTVVGDERELIGNFPLRISRERQWVVRIDLNAKEGVFLFSVTEPAAPDNPREVQADQAQGLLLFESQQAWQGSGRYTLCTFGGERLMAWIGLTGEKDLPERVPARSVEFVRRTADGKPETRCSVPWMPGQKNAHLALPVPGSVAFQRARCWIERSTGNPILRLRLRQADTSTFPAAAVSHDLWLTPRIDGQTQTACDQDGEKLEIQLTGGIAP